LNADYAAIRFADEVLHLDVLIRGFNSVSRFTVQRNPGEDPTSALDRLVNHIGEIWHTELDGGKTRRAALEAAIKASVSCDVRPESIVPRCGPTMTREQKRALQSLRISQEELAIGGEQRLLSAYRKMARLCHPDIGGSQGEMAEVNTAKEVLVTWLNDASSSRTRRLARAGIWCYIGKTASWIPPM
jgi:hypothetical protein